MKNLLKLLERIEFTDYIANDFKHLSDVEYQSLIIRFSYIIVLVLGIISLLLSIFVFRSIWALISYPTQAINGVIFAVLGIYWSYHKPNQARLFLVPYLTVNVLFSLALGYQTNSLISVTTTAYTLNIPIIFSAFLLEQKHIIYSTIATIMGVVLVSSQAPTDFTLDIVAYNSSIAINMIVLAIILFSLRQIINIRTNQLEQTSQQKSQIISTIRHEIRQPLGGLRLTLDKLASQEAYEHESTQKQLTSARNAVTFIDAIVGNIQHIQKTDNTSTRYQLINLQSLLDDVVISFANSSIVFEAVLSTEHDYFYGDIVAIKQILYNLISNSIRHTQTGTVLAGIGVIDDKFMIGVSDTGIGIKPEDQERMFNLYTKGATSTGQGIGLAVVKQIIEQHNGTIEFQSSPNEDTTFIISLPVIQKKFLYFEDNAFDREYMRQIFEDIPGWDMTIFPNAVNWQAEIETHQPDIVFLDIDMPHIQGDEVVIEAKPIFPNTIFIAHTTNSDQEYRDYYRTLPFDGFIPKSATRAIIVECVSRVGIGADIWF